jgi:hypothetical protein
MGKTFGPIPDVAYDIAPATDVMAHPVDEFDWPGAAPIRPAVAGPPPGGPPRCKPSPTPADEFDGRWADFGGQAPDARGVPWPRAATDVLRTVAVVVGILALLGLFALALAPRQPILDDLTRGEVGRPAQGHLPGRTAFQPPAALFWPRIGLATSCSWAWSDLGWAPAGKIAWNALSAA